MLGGAPVTGTYAEKRRSVPVVLMCERSGCAADGLLQPVCENYFAPLGIAMLTLDMPPIGFSSKWKLTQDTSLLHQHALRHRQDMPWVDQRQVAAFRFPVLGAEMWPSVWVIWRRSA